MEYKFKYRHVIKKSVLGLYLLNINLLTSSQASISLIPTELSNVIVTNLVNSICYICGSISDFVDQFPITYIRCLS